MSAAKRFQGKRIPWQDVITYNTLHQETIEAQVKLQKHSDSSKLPLFESEMPAYFFTLYQKITKILKDNNIIEEEEQIKSDIGIIKINVDQIKENQKGMQSQQNVGKGSFDVHNNYVTPPQGVQFRTVGTVDIDTHFTDSRCITSRKQKQFLLKELGNKPVAFILLYSARKHGWYSHHFHSRCDDKGATVSFFKSGDDVIGGYTKWYWSSHYEGKYYLDPSSLLFNLRTEQSFPCQGGETGGIKSYYASGPCFGKSELGAWYEPFNGDGSCSSYANCYSYPIPEKGGINTLTSRKNGPFAISELEVWQVIEQGQ